MKAFWVLVLVLNFGCATSAKWKAENENLKSVAKVEFGTVEITPVESLSYSGDSDVLAIEVRVNNSSGKIVNLKTEHIFASTNSGYSTSPLSDDELKAWTARIGAMSSALVVGWGANSSYATNNLYVEMKAKQLQNKPISPKGFTKGLLWFLVPKNETTSISFKFYESLASKDELVFRKIASEAPKKKSNGPNY